MPSSETSTAAGQQELINVEVLLLGMAKTLPKTKSLIPRKPEIKHFSKFAPKETALSQKFRAAVGFDKTGRPAWFLFDSYAFWELLCRIDEKLFETLPDNLYDSSPVGETIDKIESNWPFSKEYREEMKREYERALKDIASGKVSSLSL